MKEFFRPPGNRVLCLSPFGPVPIDGFILHVKWGRDDDDDDAEGKGSVSSILENSKKEKEGRTDPE